tara:strand:- start:97 stop:318 length:222 start_codon:yes stop_codon:yes gene_type:complete
MANANPSDLGLESKISTSREDLIKGYKPKPKPKPKPKSADTYPKWPGRDKAEAGIRYITPKGNLIELGSNEEW